MLRYVLGLAILLSLLGCGAATEPEVIGVGQDLSGSNLEQVETDQRDYQVPDTKPIMLTVEMVGEGHDVVTLSGDDVDIEDLTVGQELDIFHIRERMPINTYLGYHHGDVYVGRARVLQIAEGKVLAEVLHEHTVNPILIDDVAVTRIY
jgi:hypothetical protein